MRSFPLKKFLKETIQAETSRKNLGIPFFRYHLKMANNFIGREIRAKRQLKSLGFCVVNIETYGYCNRKCEFCFNNEKFPKREQGIMELGTFYKTINELTKLKYSGRISPYHYGEPLLDARLPYLVEEIKAKLPNCHVLLATNGDFLNENVIVDFINKGVDRFIVTNYDDVEKPLLKMLAKKYPFYVKLRSHEEIVKVDRAGFIFKGNEILNAPCMRPSSQMVIDWKGDVFLCCQDFYGEYWMGNVNESRLLDIWNSEKFTRYRGALSLGKRSGVTICQHCDYNGKAASVFYGWRIGETKLVKPAQFEANHRTERRDHE